MKAAAVIEKHKKAHVIDQLHKLGFYETHGMDYEDLVQKLAIERYKLIDHDSPENRWF